MKLLASPHGTNKNANNETYGDTDGDGADTHLCQSEQFIHTISRYSHQAEGEDKYGDPVVEPCFYVGYESRERSSRSWMQQRINPWAKRLRKMIQNKKNSMYNPQNVIPRRKTEELRIIGSIFSPDLLAIQWMPTARVPAVDVATALLIPLYKQPPAHEWWIGFIKLLYMRIVSRSS